MLRALGFVPAVLALVAWGSSAAFGSAHVPCGPAGAHTLASNHVARVYVVHDIAYGCSGRHTFRLGGSPGDFPEHFGPVALAGTVAAYGLADSATDTVFASVVVRRLTDGKQLRNLAATTAPLGPESVQSVDAVVVKSDGAVAWVATGNSIVMGNRRDVELLKADSRGEVRLDSGSGIKAATLRLRGTRLTWVHGTETRSASLH